MRCSFDSPIKTPKITKNDKKRDVALANKRAKFLSMQNSIILMFFSVSKKNIHKK